MKASSLIQVVCAAHWSYKVQPDPFKRRGGIMLVAPAGHGKTSVMNGLSDGVPKMLFLSDFTTRQAVALRGEIVAGRYQTLVIDEFEKLYQRQDSTASNIEGTLQALIEQGFYDTPGEKPSGDIMRAQCLVVANMTEEFYARKQKHWTPAFLRRWLICKFKLDKPDIFADAIEQWKRVEIRDGLLFMAPMEDIPYSVTKREARFIRNWLQMSDRDDKTPQQLLHKILSVLRWRFKLVGRADQSFDILSDFAQSINKQGTNLKL